MNMLSKEEDQRLLDVVCRTTGRRVSEDEARVVRDWAREVRVKQAFLELLLAGRAGIVVSEGELHFTDIGHLRPPLDDGR
jgi:hypothetical protein